MSAKHCTAEAPNGAHAVTLETAFGCPRDFLGNRFVYAVISPRARGLSLGINMNPDKFCNFDCVYCEVNRAIPSTETELDVSVMTAELEKTLLLIHSGAIRQLLGFNQLSPEFLNLHHVAFSGDGEPTLCARFTEAVETVAHIRARRFHPFFKMVLITNGTWLDLPVVQDGLRSFTGEDEIWLKLEAGSQDYMDKVNRSEVPLEKVMANAKLVGKKRPIIIQSLFPAIAGKEPSCEEIDLYVKRLIELKDAGVMISLVQIYSATRPTLHSDCGHLPLRTLAAIRQRIKAETGLKAEVF